MVHTNAKIKSEMERRRRSSAGYGTANIVRNNGMDIIRDNATRSFIIHGDTERERERGER